MKNRKIVVTGGKGGTGKSTIAILIAFKALNQGKKVLLVDLDIECPNDYLILGINKLTNPSSNTYCYYPEIDPKKCKKCGLCISSCSSNALFKSKDSIPKLHKTLCSSCGVCWEICPHNAIKKVKEKNGEIYINKLSDNFTLATGRIIPGIRETSPVVTQTKKYLESYYKNFDLVIFDTAAGTHCNVIKALEGNQRAIAVTEPTPLGKHDLNIILKVLKVLNIPSHIVINQFDIGDINLIKEISKNNHSPIIGELPYNKKLAKIYSNGRFFENKNLSKLLNLNLVI